MRDTFINLRTNAGQRELIGQAAVWLPGKKLTDFMLEAVREKAQDVMLDQVFFSLNAQEKRFG